MIKPGEAYLFMSVTHYHTGRVREVTPTCIILDDAAWIPDTGRLSECLKNGNVNECEPVGDGLMLIHFSGSVYPWKHALPSKLK